MNYKAFAPLIGIVFSLPIFAGVEEQLISSQETPLQQNTSLAGWHADISLAQKEAKDSGRPLLIAFLGPNWCPYSDQFEEEVLASQAFLKSLKKEVVFLKIDIPEDYEQQPEIALKKKYQIDECPTLILATSSLEKIAKIESLPFEAATFAGYIKQVLSDFAQVSTLAEKTHIKHLANEELKSLYAKAGKLADATFKKALLSQGLKTDNSPYFLLEEYGEMKTSGKYKERQILRIRNKILARDPENLQGCRRKLAIMDFDALAIKAANPEQVIKPLTEYLKKFGERDLENAWQLEMKISKFLYGQNHIEEALNHARSSFTLAPENQRREIEKSIEYLTTISNESVE